MKPTKTTHRIIVLILAGAIGGTVGDLCHVLSGTEGYPRFPYWVPAMFGVAGLLMGWAHPYFDQLVGTQHLSRPGLTSSRRVWLGVAALVITWALSGFLPLPTGSAKDVFVAAAAILSWWLLERTWSGVVLAGLTACAGTAVEILQFRAGLFYYTPTHQNLLGVPSWLPWLYVCASVTVGNLGRMLAWGTSAQPAPSR